MDEHKEGVLLDYDYYHPTLHNFLDELVYRDTSLPGCYMDWITINQMINESALLQFAMRIVDIQYFIVIKVGKSHAYLVSGKS